MKRVFSLMLSLIVALTLTACKSSSSSADETQDNEIQAQTETQQETKQQEEVPQEEVQIPDPVVYTGSGDDVIQIDPPDSEYVFRISGNQGGEYFAVKAYDSLAEYIDLLVNTTSAYSGVTYDPTQSTALLEINATGDWTVELVSIYAMEALISGNSISGEGDTVLQVFPPVLTADITGNENSGYFAVKSYDTNGDYLDLLVNTTDPYSGTVMMGLDTSTLVISAEGPWTITAG